VFIASEWRITETGVEVQVSRSSIHEWWKAKRRTLLDNGHPNGI